MATFQVQVTGLTGITMSSSGTNPTEAQLTEFLREGVSDVVNRVILLEPGRKQDFSKETAVTGGSGASVLSPSHVISAIRADGTASQYRNATQISPALKFLSQSEDSLYYKSKYNPSWYYKDGKVYILPDPAVSPNDGIVTHVTYDTGVAYSDAIPDNFPADLVYLVALYASCRTLLNAMGATISSFGSYTAPVITNASDGSFAEETDQDITELSRAAWTAIDYDFDNENIDFLKWFQVAGDMIQNQEDIELATIQLQKIGTYITGYNSAMQNNVSKQNDNVDKLVKDYSWMSDRYDKLNNEYYGYFKDIQDKKAQQQQAQQQAQQSYGR